MQTNKAEPCNDEVGPLTDNILLTSETPSPDNETVSSIDDTVPPKDEAVPSSPDEIISPKAEIEPPINDAVSTAETVFPEAETKLSTDDTIVANDEPIATKIEPSTDNTTSANDETVFSTENIVPVNTETKLSTDNAMPATDETISPSIETELPIDEKILSPIDAPLPVEPQQTWRTLAEPWWKATLAILPTFLITRFIFLLLSYFGGVLFFVKNYATTVISFHDMVYRWNWWDAKRFATIATQGYPTPDYAAFFPLYPTLVHAFTVLTHRDVLESSMFISNVAFLGMLIVLYRFVTVEFDKETAQRTALYISIFPTALFFFAGYNESLFLLFTLLCFYTMRHGSWWLAGLFGLLATLTRSSGIFLALVFVCEYLQQNWPLLREIWQSKKLSRAIHPLAQLPAVFLIPLGLAIYSYGLYRRFHNPLEFIKAQSYWRQGLTFPLYAPLATLKKILTFPLFTFVTPHNIIDLTAAVLFVALLVLCFVGPERINRSQWTFPLFSLLILVTTMLYPTLPSQHGMYDPLASTQRLVLEAFVGFIILARFGRRLWFHQFYLLISLPLLAFLTLQFMTGHWTV